MAANTLAAESGPARDPARGAKWLALLAPLRVRSYVLLWAAASVSFLGDQIQLVALPVFVLDMTHRPAALGAVLTAQAVPRMVLLLAGGVAIDRFQPKRVLVGSSVLAGAIVAAMAAMAVTGTSTLWRLYVLAALLGASSAAL